MRLSWEETGTSACGSERASSPLGLGGPGGCPLLPCCGWRQPTAWLAQTTAPGFPPLEEQMKLLFSRCAQGAKSPRTGRECGIVWVRLGPVGAWALFKQSMFSYSNDSFMFRLKDCWLCLNTRAHILQINDL